MTFTFLDIATAWNGDDYVNIYDGDSTSAPLLGTFDGNELPSQPIPSTGGVVLVKFYAGWWNQAEGFSLDYSTV